MIHKNALVFPTFLHTEMVQVIEIFPRGLQGLSYHAYSSAAKWLLMNMADK